MPKTFLIKRRCSICGVDEICGECDDCCIDTRKPTMVLPLRFDIAASELATEHYVQYWRYIKSIRDLVLFRCDVTRERGKRPADEFLSPPKLIRNAKRSQIWRPYEMGNDVSKPDANSRPITVIVDSAHSLPSSPSNPSSPYGSCDLCPSSPSCTSESSDAYPSNPSTPDKTPATLHYCYECGKAFERASSLSNHRLIHKNNKIWKCTKCESSFLRKSDLAKHQVVHTGNKPFECDWCGRRFSQSSNMLTHKRRHTGIKPHQCRECGKRFYRNVDLKRHTKTHTRWLQ